MPDQARRLKGQHIDPAIWRYAAKVSPHEFGKKPTCRTQDAPLLGGRDTRCSAAIAARRALPHFYKYKKGAVAYHQV